MSGTDDSEFTAFASAGEVQVGDTNLTAAEAPKPVKTARRAPPKPAAAPAAAAPAAPAGDDAGNAGAGDGANADGGAGDGDDDFDLGRVPGEDDGDAGDNQEGDQGEDSGDGEDENNGKRESAEGRMKRLKRERREALDRARAAEAKLASFDADSINARFAALEKTGLPARTAPSNNVDKVGPAPDPLDQAKYPLGHLDAQYVEDRINWTADFKLAQKADTDLQRQQENQRTEAQQAEQQRVLKTVDAVAKKGADIYDDFQEVVVDPGMKGEWKLQQATFEAAADPDIQHGARILYNLAKNPQEAQRVFDMSPIQQLRYVDKKNAEIEEKITRRKIPGAGAPPTTRTRGGNSRVSINPATDNLDDFEKLVRQDEARSRK